jgi:superfamily II DNA or RNA helicase
MGTSELTFLHSPVAALATARARFGASLDATELEPALGSVTLRPDQVETARRVRSMLRREGGCLLADDVGTGKTYVALALARTWRRPLVVMPASLRSTWEGAMRRAALPCATTTHESLSRGTVPTGAFDGIIVDESHRFRPTSNRHAALARLASHAPLLLLSATPLQNHARELAAQIALFIGETAYALEPAALTRWIVRATSDVDRALPAVAPPAWVQPDANDGDVLEALLALPPPPRAADAGDGGALLLLSLVRAWASSRAALLATIRRRRRSLVALEQCHADARVPTRRELASWQGGDAVQLGFPTMLAATAADRATAEQRATAIIAERDALDVVWRAIERVPDPDVARARALRDLRTRHGNVAILAFSEFANTVRAYFAALRAQRGVGMLTANEARIASGRLSRAELLARFAPRAQGASMPHPRERITLLLATDLLSEGVNLQDAAVVVHLDLPWNPARLAQRLGRIRRPGGASEVASYLMAPPTRSALLLRAERRLRDKLAQAEQTIGRGLDVLPALSVGTQATAPSTAPSARDADSPLAIAELRGEIHRILTRWRSDSRAVIPSECLIPSERSECVIPNERSERVIPSERSESRDLHSAELTLAATRSTAHGWIAVLDDGRLVTSLRDDHPTAEDDDHATEDIESLLRALRHADGAARPTNDLEVRAALRRLEQRIAHDWARRSCAVVPHTSPLRQRVLRRIDGALSVVARHQRRSALSHASSLRAALNGRLTLGMERALDGLPDDRDGVRWLARAAALLPAPSDPGSLRQDAAHAARARAIILFGPA